MIRIPVKIVKVQAKIGRIKLINKLNKYLLKMIRRKEEGNPNPSSSLNFFKSMMSSI